MAASVRSSIDLAEAQPQRRGAANVEKRRHLRRRKGKKSIGFCRRITAAKRARTRVQLLLDPIEYGRILRRAALDGATLDRLVGGGGHPGLGYRYQHRQLQQARAAAQGQKIAAQGDTIAAQGRRIAALLRNATPAADPSPPNELRWFYDLENCPPGWIETKSLRGYLLVRVNDLQMLRVRSLR